MTAENIHVDAYLRPDQKDGLDRRSKKSGVPVAALIRNAVDRVTAVLNSVVVSMKTFGPVEYK